MIGKRSLMQSMAPAILELPHINTHLGMQEMSLSEMQTRLL